MIETYVLTTEDAQLWRTVLPADRSVQGSVEYMRLQERQTGWAARLFVVQGSKPVAAYPYFLRPVKTLPFAAELDEDWFDTRTPDYSGPLWLDGRTDSHDQSISFPDLFAAHCREQGIIAEFAHLNPWISQDLLQPEYIRPNRDLIYVDLNRNEDEIWAGSLSSDARRQTKQGQRAGVVVRRTLAEDDVREFHRLYELTMDRLQASDRYRYPVDYFLEFADTMSANAFLVLAEYEGRAVAAGLFMYDRHDIYWHLSAADREWGHVRPVNVYLFETIRQSLGSEWERMILGGAYQDGDGVFRFKANFSRLRADFNTYQRVHNADAYDALTKAWQAHHGQMAPSEGFFPSYRAEPSKPLVS